MLNIQTYFLLFLLFLKNQHIYKINTTQTIDFYCISYFLLFYSKVITSSLLYLYNRLMYLALRNMVSKITIIYIPSQSRFARPTPNHPDIHSGYRPRTRFARPLPILPNLYSFHLSLSYRISIGILYQFDIPIVILLCVVFLCIVSYGGSCWVSVC